MMMPRCTARHSCWAQMARTAGVRDRRACTRSHIPASRRRGDMTHHDVARARVRSARTRADGVSYVSARRGRTRRGRNRMRGYKGRWHPWPPGRCVCFAFPAVVACARVLHAVRLPTTTARHADLDAVQIPNARDGSRRFQLHAMRKSPSAPRGCWLRGRWWIPEGRRCRRRRRQRAQDVLAAHALCSRTARGLTVMAVARRRARARLNDRQTRCASVRSGRQDTSHSTRVDALWRPDTAG